MLVVVGGRKLMTKLFLMIGLPASGKSTLAEQIAKSEDAEIVSSDNIRKELYGDENIQGDNNKVFRILQERIINGLKNNKNMIYDAYYRDDITGMIINPFSDKIMIPKAFLKIIIDEVDANQKTTANIS